MASFSETSRVQLKYGTHLPGEFTASRHELGQLRGANAKLCCSESYKRNIILQENDYESS